MASRRWAAGLLALALVLALAGCGEKGERPGGGSSGPPKRIGQSACGPGKCWRGF